MKTKLIAASLMVVLALSLLACSPSAKDVSLEVSIDDLMSQNHISQQVEITAGGSLTVTLGSNPTTGFSWSENAQISDQTVLQQTGHEFISPTQTMPGAPGKELWTFKALKAGTSTVSLEYSRPWEGGEKGEWTYTLNVTVK
jgi:inhibitor of cysteine peptidase